MPTVRQVLDALEPIAPRRYAFSFDKVGLQVGDPDAAVTRAVVSLDRSLAAARHCREVGAQLLLAHHPLIFRPIDSVDARTHVGRTILELVKADVSFFAAHTNWDSAQGGINDTLAATLALSDVQPFGAGTESKALKLVFTCPPHDADRLVETCSEAGAGVIGAYTRCSFRSAGHGTFYGGEGTRPAVGEAGRLEVVDEVRVEMALPASASKAVVRALLKAHPYEEPAYDLYLLRDEVEQPIARCGTLHEPQTLREFARFVDDRLQTRCWAWGDADKRIRRVAVCGGAADDEWMNAQRAGADVLVTGEVKQHVAVEASESGMCIIAAGHYATEHPGCATLRDRMAEAVPEVEWLLFSPGAGTAGRPL